MNIFWQEYVHFIVAMFAILVSVSAWALFLLTYYYEKHLRTVWRALGFFLLALAFFLFILERKFSSFGLLAVVTELLGFISIYRGVLAEPKLSQLRKVSLKEKGATKGAAQGILNALLQPLVNKLRDPKNLALFITLLVLLGVLVFYSYIFPISVASRLAAIFSYLASFLELIVIVFVILTIRIQVKRYKSEVDPGMKRQDLYPLIGYIFFALRGVAHFLFRLPASKFVSIYSLTLSFSLAWQFMVIFTFFGFFFLAIWAWNFIKVRRFLRTYVVILTIAVVVSSLGCLVFTTLIFGIVERNNLQLMQRGAETEQLIFDERAYTALFIARTIANDTRLLNSVKNNSYQSALEQTEKYFKDSGIDYLRIYNPFGEVMVSPSDPRDKGKVFSQDNLLAFAITKKSQVRTFATEAGVLSPIIITRAIYPLLVEGSIVGAVEVGYKFDNAFVDYSKKKTGLDVTIYVGSKRSATTLRTIDGVSRWVGSEETDKQVLDKALKKGESYLTAIDRLGVPYYSAFTPIRDVNGEIIGMVSVGAPTAVLFENTRQQLLSSFLIVTIISLLMAFMGYTAIKSFRKEIAAESMTETAGKV